jgi:hypothetical protein
MSDAAALPAEIRNQTDEPKKLDDVMLAMDIVDTLRHREKLIDRELSVEARKEKLIARLKDIYAAQGIDVPDRILADGVKALEEKRFAFEPPKNSFAVSLARFYIGRDRWLAPVAVIFGIAAFATAVWELGFEAPREAKARAAEIELTDTLPTDLQNARDAALAVAETDGARARIETAYQDGVFATENRNADAARAAIEDIATLRATLAKDLDIRVVSNPEEYSGVFRVHEDNPTQRNYYLIVEAVDARGRTHLLEIASEEDRSTRRAGKWGVRVPEGEFNRIAADKQDDQIIQNAVIGEKPKGALKPTYDIETAGGAILEW